MSSLWAQLGIPLIVAIAGTAIGNHINLKSILQKIGATRRKNVLADVATKIDLYERLKIDPLRATAMVGKLASIALILLGLSTLVGVTSALIKASVFSFIFLLLFYVSWFSFFYVIGRLIDFSRDLHAIDETLLRLRERQESVSNDAR